MKSIELGLPAKPSHAGSYPLLTFEHLLRQYKKDIEWYASGFSKSWKDDFYQEGANALFDAYRRFLVLPPDREFRPYALKAIKNRMVDFNRKTNDRAPTIGEPVIVNYNDEALEDEYIYNVTGDVNFFSTITFDIDYEIIFNERNLKAKGFTNSEITAFRLFMVHDQPVQEIARELRVTVGRASQIISSVRAKSLLLLNYFNN